TSYDPQSHRAGSRENAKLMLAACKKFSASVIMGSDAHINFDVGNHKFSQEVLKENNFPQELIVNDDVKKFLNFVKFRKILTPS
ncbi:MAG: phosphatase, partial [Selenomonadaceae bacterium]|nr:phosphatase [Selenomonadaceae bacterium]